MDQLEKKNLGGSPQERMRELYLDTRTGILDENLDKCAAVAAQLWEELNDEIENKDSVNVLNMKSIFAEIGQAYAHRVSQKSTLQ